MKIRSRRKYLQKRLQLSEDGRNKPGSRIDRSRARICSRREKFSNFGLLRFLAGKVVGTYAIGSSDPKFSQMWTELFPQKPADPAAPVKTHEFELVKNLFMALDPELKAARHNIDPKTAMIQEGPALGDWQQITTEASLQLPIGTKSGDLVIEIPLYDIEFAKLSPLIITDLRKKPVCLWWMTL